VERDEQRLTANVPEEVSKQDGFEEVFSIFIEVDQPVVVGQDEVVGRRQLIPILSGEVIGNGFKGKVLPGGIDSQIIRPEGNLS